MPLASLATWLSCLPSLVLTYYSSEYPSLLFLLVGEGEPGGIYLSSWASPGINRGNMVPRIGDLSYCSWEGRTEISRMGEWALHDFCWQR